MGGGKSLKRARPYNDFHLLQNYFTILYCYITRIVSVNGKNSTGPHSYSSSELEKKIIILNVTVKLVMFFFRNSTPFSWAPINDAVNFSDLFDAETRISTLLPNTRMCIKIKS